MENSIFKNKEIYNNFLKIFKDEGFGLKSYGFKRVVFEKNINSTGKIQYNTAIKLLKVYNDYYKLNFKVSDLFIDDKLLNKKGVKKVIFEYIDDGNYTLNKVIEEVLSLIKNLFSNKEKKDDNIEDEGYLYKQEDLEKKQILFFVTTIIFVIIIFIIYKKCL